MELLYTAALFLNHTVVMSTLIIESLMMLTNVWPLQYPSKLLSRLHLEVVDIQSQRKPHWLKHDRVKEGLSRATSITKCTQVLRERW